MGYRPKSARFVLSPKKRRSRKVRPQTSVPRLRSDQNSVTQKKLCSNVKPKSKGFLFSRRSTVNLFVSNAFVWRRNLHIPRKSKKPMFPTIELALFSSRLLFHEDICSQAVLWYEPLFIVCVSNQLPDQRLHDGSKLGILS